MNKIIEELNLIEKYTPDLRGVFTIADLKNIFPSKHINTFYRKLSLLENKGILKRVVRGIYVAKSYDLNALSQKICPNSYISLETILARELIIGTVPRNTVRAIKLGKKREYNFDNKNIVHLEISPHLYFGFETNAGINFANKEKAFLDTLYFYNKGIKFYFDIYSDMNVSKLDMKIIFKYLKKYKNPKFINFVRTYLSDYSIS